MYTFTANGSVTITCGACGVQTPAWTAVKLRVGDPPQFGRVETGRWDFTENCAETRLLKFSRTDAVEACPACADRLRAQKRAGGPNHLPRPRPNTFTPTRPVETYLTAMPRLIKHRKAATP